MSTIHSKSPSAVLQGRPEIAAAYWRAHRGALWVEHRTPGQVVMRGRTRVDFLHRMSTQDVLDQPMGTIRPNVLTTPIARIIDWIQVVHRADDLLLLTSPGRARRVSEWLASYVFFQDEVALDIVENGAVHFGVYGPGAVAAAARRHPSLGDLKPGQAVGIEGGIGWRADLGDLLGIKLLFSSGGGGVPPEAVPDPDAAAAYQALRIEAGLPEFGAEVEEDSNPLDVGLDSSISFEKGCYVGQEIIARMQSRGKRARRLIGLRLSEEIHAPAVVVQGGADVGRLTSAAFSPALGWVGLAVVRTAAAESSQQGFQVGDSSIAAQREDLPMKAQTGVLPPLPL